MAIITGATELEYTVLPPNEFYEAVITKVERVPNDKGQFAYNPATDPPHKSHQLKWTFKVREGEFAGTEVIAFTSQALSTHVKAVLPKWLAAILGDAFDITSDLDTDELIGRNVRILVDNQTKEKDGKTLTYNKVTSLAASKLPSLDAADIEAMRKAALTASVAADLGAEEIPF